MTTIPFHCVGIGCGPSNLSIASLLYGQPDVRSVFFESKPEFSWHRGMLLPGTSLQVSMFKDLVTLADPGNRFSFTSYLHQHGRLIQFLNARFAQISRQEFADYLHWAAHANENIRFGESVLSVDFDGRYFVVETSERRVLGENVMLGVGITPSVPDFARMHLDNESHFHVHNFAMRPRCFGGRRVIVVGGGQSGAEVVLHLLRSTGENAPSEVTWLTLRENFFPLDDSPFTNDLFSPTHADYFFEQEQEFRKGFLERNVLASDGISEQTLCEIYQRIYTMRYIERLPMRIRLMPYRKVNEIRRKDAEWTLGALHQKSGDAELVSADVVVWATGFQSAAMPFLQPLNARIVREGGEIRIDRDYAAIWDGPADRRIFVLNAARRQRGLADPNLSLTAWRSQIVIDRMLGRPRRSHLTDDAFVHWAPTAPNTQHLALDMMEVR